MPLRERTGRVRSLAVLGLCLLATFAAASAQARAGTVYFSTANLFFSGKLWSVRDDGTHRKILRSKVFTGPSGVVATLSRDGKRILCLCRRGEVDSLALDGGDLRRIGSRPRGTRYDVVGLGSASETLWLEERHDRLIMQNADRSHPRVVAAGSGKAYVGEEFAISPTGRAVAYTVGRCGAHCREGEEEVWIAPVGGGPKKRVYRVVGQRGIGGMQWSRDGRALSFVDFPEEEKYEVPPDPADHLFVYSGGSPREVPVQAPARTGEAFFGPNREELALPGVVDGTLYAVGLDGQPRRRILGGHCGEVQCAFGIDVFGWTGG